MNENYTINREVEVKERSGSVHDNVIYKRATVKPKIFSLIYSFVDVLMDSCGHQGCVVVHIKLFQVCLEDACAVGVQTYTDKSSCTQQIGGCADVCIQLPLMKFTSHGPSWNLTYSQVWSSGSVPVYTTLIVIIYHICN